MIAKNKNGFTLIELMIVVAVVGILAAIAYPSYTDSVRKAHRADGKGALMEAAQRMETIYARDASYANATLASPSSPEGYFTIAITSQDASSYTLQATAVGSQTYDSIKAFQITETGEKTHLDGTVWRSGWDN
ncbi:type IV pilin protein [Thiolapillus sp.]